MMLAIDWRLALVTFAVIPLVWLTAAVFRRRVREAFRDIRIRLARLNAFPAGTALGDAGGAALRPGGGSAARFAELNRDHLAAHLRSITIYAVFFPVVEVLTAMAMALLLWYGGLRVLDGTLTVGVLAAFIQYTRRFFQPLQDLSEKVNLLQSAMASSERVFALLDEPVTVQEPVAPAAPGSAGAGEVRFEGVWFRYSPEGPWVLRDISFTASPGRTMALVGHTGAGKTTIVSLLLRFYDPERGRITDRWGRYPGAGDGGAPLADRLRAAGPLPLHRRHPAQPHAGRAHHAGPAGEAARRVGADRFIERLPEGYAHRLGERGPESERGRAAASQLRAGASARSGDPRARRSDQFGGRRGGGADPGRDRGADGGPHQPGRGAPPEHHPPCR